MMSYQRELEILTAEEGSEIKRAALVAGEFLIRTSRSTALR